MQEVKIWHNSKCSKSRATLELLQNENCKIDVVSYLETTPSTEEIKTVLCLLKVNARALMRTKETLYEELNLSDIDLSEEALIQSMYDNPSLIERPVVLANGKAAIGRPLENVIKILS